MCSSTVGHGPTTRRAGGSASRSVRPYDFEITRESTNTMTPRSVAVRIRLHVVVGAEQRSAHPRRRCLRRRWCRSAIGQGSAVRPGAEARNSGAGRRNRRAWEPAHWRGGTRRGRTRLGGSGTRRRGRRSCGGGRARWNRRGSRLGRRRRWSRDDGGLGRLDHGHGLPDIAAFGAAHLATRRRDHRRRLETRIAGRTDNDRHCLEPPRAGFTWCKPAHAFAQIH